MHSARGWGSKGRSDLVPSLKGYSLGGVEVRGVRAHQRNVCSNVATRDVSTWLGEPRAGQDQVMTLYVCCEDEQRKSFCLLKQSSRTRGPEKVSPVSGKTSGLRLLILRSLWSFFSTARVEVGISGRVAFVRVHGYLSRLPTGNFSKPHGCLEAAWKVVRRLTPWELFPPSPQSTSC